VRSETDSWRSNLNWWLAAAVGMGAAFWFGIAPQVGLIAGGSMLLMTAAVHFGRRRNDALGVISGAGDERVRDLSTRATAAAGGLLAIVVLAWWLVTVARGEPNTTLSILWSIFALASLAATLYYSRRS
jgi:uncharacterized membrane protein